MATQTGLGRALAELVRRLTLEEKQEFARSLSWDELEELRHEASISSSLTEPADKPAGVRRVGEPKVYVGTTVDGLAFELPANCVVEFSKRLGTLLSVSSISVYLRRNGAGEEYHLRPEKLDEFLDTHQEALLSGSLMMELDDATLVSGGDGCMLLSLEGISSELQRRLAAEALRLCGFDYEFTGDSFTATVWDDALEVSEQ